MNSIKKIELLVSLDDAYGRAVTRGIIRYAKTRLDWKLFGSGNLFPSPAELGGEVPDGIIARIESLEHARILAAMGLPIVDVAGAYLHPAIAQVKNDDIAAGKKAGQYFKQLGFTEFAVCGVEKVTWWQSRKSGFLEAISKKSTQISVFERSLSWWKDRDQGAAELGDFLLKLKSSTAVFAANDLTGLKVARHCTRQGIAVPDTVALLGVDNEDLFCELSLPSLSSIALDCEGIGFGASRLLSSLMDTHEQGLSTSLSSLQTTKNISPLDVVERESSRILLCSDEIVSKAISWIHTNVQSGITVNDVLEHVSASRRSLEQRFLKALGRSPHDEIVLARLKRAKLILSSGNATLEVVARASGFGSLQRLHVAFKKAESISPGEWRTREST